MFAALTLLIAQAAAPAQPAPIPALDESYDRIQKIDSAMFHAAFEGCDAATVRSHITDDFRMVHDQGGIVADNGDDFAANLAKSCEGRKPGGPIAGYKSRRLLVPGSDSVTPIGDWGVLHRGWHTFHEWRGAEDGWVQVGGARFLNIYQWMPEEGRFRMQETISIDHG